MAKTTGRSAAEALERAQDLIYDAWEAPTARRRAELAKKALALNPHCADAYVLLATGARRGSDEELDLWQRGVVAGEQALGKAAFEGLAGGFWGFLETRPYMRARFGLARALWERGNREAAIDHLKAMLVLNPGDNQGIRYTLTAYLADMERNDDLEALLAQYPDECSAEWSWTAALLAFRRVGDNAESRQRLAEAVSVNAHVRNYLGDEAPMPKQLPPFTSPGDVTEAIHYVAAHRSGWLRTSGAVDWVRSQAPTSKARTRRSRRSDDSGGAA